MNDRYDIVVTGIAAISAAGVGIVPLVDAVRSGTSVLQPVPREVTGGDGLLWGKAEAFRAADFMPPLKARRFDRASLFAVAAAGMALKDAGIDPRAGNGDRVGIALGCGFGGIANSEEFLRGWFEKGQEGLVPMLFPNTVPNAPASNASIEHGMKGPNVTQVQRFCSAEAAIQMACRFLEEGRADVMLTGGVDELNPVVMQGFASAGQLHSWAKGFGEGCGMLVLERRDSAAARGATPRAAITGIRTVGRLIPGRKEEGAERICGSGTPGCISFSGCADELPFLADRFRGSETVSVGRLIGRSLAMGGVTLAALAAMLPAGRTGLHLAASPEGPYFAIDLAGGAPVQP